MLNLRQASSCKLTLLAGTLALILILAQTQHVELADSSPAPASPWRFPSSIKTKLNQLNFGNFRQQIRARIGDLASRAFEVFTKTYNRTYTPEELGERLNLFVERFKMIQSWNRDYLTKKVSFTMKLNHLADRTADEWDRLNGLRTPMNFNETLSEPAPSRGSLKGGRSLSASYTNLQASPESKDWRTSNCLAQVRDQGSCGCCYAFATVDMVGFNYCVESGPSASTRQLRSPQQIIDCGSRDWQYGQQMNGCNGGWPEQNIKYLQKKQYLATEKDYPYKMRKETCKLSSGLDVSRASGAGPKYVELRSENAFKEHIGNHGPVVAAVHASYAFQLYNNGIFDDYRCAGRQWNHAILVVGYGRESGKDYWIVKNSYGSDWGENGYMRMIRGKNSCKVGLMGWGLIPSNKSSPGSKGNSNSSNNNNNYDTNPIPFPFSFMF